MKTSGAVSHPRQKPTADAAQPAEKPDPSAPPADPHPGAPNVAGLLPESAVATLIDHAVRMPASDLFFSINDNHVGVSVRHLGIVRLLTMLTPEQGRRCSSYIKVMAGMDLAEQRRPLDGRWVLGADGVGAGRVQPADQHDPDPVWRGPLDPTAGLQLAADGPRPDRHDAEGAQRADRDARGAQRLDPRHRADRIRQDHDPVRLPEAPE